MKKDTKYEKKPNKDKELATFIIRKYVNEKSIVWSRDFKFAYGLLELYPEKEFWEQLSKKVETNSMALFGAEKVKYALKMQYEEWKTKKLIKSNYKPEEFQKFELEVDKPVIVENNGSKPRNGLEFCR